MFYVYSTMTNSTEYVLYAKNSSRDLPIKTHSVLIKGGANLADRVFHTPQGVVTQISDSDMEMLLKDYHFLKHVENGFIKYEKMKDEIEEVVKDMTPRDDSAPKTPDDPEFAESEPSNQVKNTFKKKGKRE